YADFGTRLPMLGSFLAPDAPALSYTQWEAWLALYHGKVLIIAVPQENAPRDERYSLVEEQRVAQQGHLARLASIERHPETHFANADRLAVELLRSQLAAAQKIQAILSAAGVAKQRSNLPYRSIAGIFKGREQELSALENRLGRVGEIG